MREAVPLYSSSLPGRLLPNLVGAMAFVPQLGRRAVRRGVGENLSTLREILEARR